MTGTTQGNPYPLPRFSFVVDIPGVGAHLSFQEVSGLDAGSETIEYRKGNSASFSPIKMPGLHKVGNVTLKRGVFARDDAFFEWYKRIALNTIERTTVTISLLDEKGAAAMTWRLANAWPTKITTPDLKADGNEVAIETLELAHEGVSVVGG